LMTMPHSLLKSLHVYLKLLSPIYSITNSAITNNIFDILQYVTLADSNEAIYQHGQRW
jgi:hypothetical protein